MSRMNSLADEDLEERMVEIGSGEGEAEEVRGHEEDGFWVIGEEETCFGKCGL